MSVGLEQASDDMFKNADADADDKITAADARMALRGAAKLNPLTGRYLYAADIDKNGLNSSLITVKHDGLNLMYSCFEVCFKENFMEFPFTKNFKPLRVGTTVIFDVGATLNP